MAKYILKKIIDKHLIAFSLCAFIIISLTLITFLALANQFEWKAISNIINNHYSRYVISFTFWQATMSTIASICLAIPIARSLHRRHKFIGRNLILKFINLSFVLPAITLILGIIIIHGKNGWINNIIHKIFSTSFDYYLYGILGVIIGHLTFCLPLAVRILLNCLESIPQETWRLTTQLNLSSFNIFKIVEWPHLKSSTISVAILIFMMCFSSFAIVLSLGGGPAVTTLEVIIYQALKLDFDLPYATGLALIQLTICTILMFFLYKYNTPLFRPILFKDKYFERPDSKKLSALIIDILSILILFIITVMPIIAILTNGFNNKFLAVLYSAELWHSATQSLLISLCSGALTLSLAFGLTSGAFYIKYTLNKPKFAKYILLISNIRLMVPTFVFSTGLFIVLNNLIDIKNIYFILIIIMNSIAALPFATSIILPPSLEFSSQELYLCQSLDIKGWNFIKLIYWPRMRKSISYALALVITISWGDLGITALFNNTNLITLPYLLYNMMSSYYIEEAAVVALVILLSSFFLFWIIEELLGGEENVKA